MAKKKHYTGPEMSALSGPLTTEQTALATASFFIAARVANAAWALLDEALKNEYVLRALETDLKLIELTNALRGALSGYSPGNWPPPPTYRAYAAQRLEELYEAASTASSREEILEKIYEFCAKEHE